MLLKKALARMAPFLTFLVAASVTAFAQTTIFNVSYDVSRGSIKTSIPRSRRRGRRRQAKRSRSNIPRRIQQAGALRSKRA